MIFSFGLKLTGSRLVKADTFQMKHYTGCIKKNGAHLLCQIISKLLKLIAQFWACFKPRSFLFRTSRNLYFYFQ